MKLFVKAEYFELHSLFDMPGYKGYRPEVRELPNGDAKVDIEKRYLHVALKYDPPDWAVSYLARAHWHACRVAEALGVPDRLYPRVENSTLRVIHYPFGAGSAAHTDFDLFTLHCYRSHPADFVKLDTVDPVAEAIDPDVHLGEIAELAGIGKATRHFVPARDYDQFAVVYFAMPAMHAEIHAEGGFLVKDWLAERMSRSRAYK